MEYDTEVEENKQQSSSTPFEADVIARESQPNETANLNGEAEAVEFIQSDKTAALNCPVLNLHDIEAHLSGDPSRNLITKFRISITVELVRSLQWDPPTWLNESVINFYLELLAERSRNRHGLPKVHCMNTNLYVQLNLGGFVKVNRWTKKVDIFDNEIVVIPIHRNRNHWCMAIMHMKDKTIKFYDSMQHGASNMDVLDTLREYLKSESLDKKKVEFDLDGWVVEDVQNIPQQNNSSDCGVFSCMYAEFITRNQQINFTQDHMQYFRQKMVDEICMGRMLT